MPVIVTNIIRHRYCLLDRDRRRVLSITCVQVLSALPDHHSIAVLRQAANATANFPPCRLQCLLRHLAPGHHAVILQASQPQLSHARSLIISPSAHRCRTDDADMWLPLLDAGLIACAAATLPPLRQLAVEHLQRGVRCACDPPHSTACSHSTAPSLAASNVATVNPCGACRPTLATRHPCDGSENPDACSVPTLPAFLRKLPHLASLTSLSLSDIDVGAGAAEAAAPTTDSLLYMCCGGQQAQHAQHVAPQALAWALRQCCKLRALTLRRLALGTPQHVQHAQHVIAPAIFSLTQLRRVSLEGVSHSPRGIDAQHAQRAGDQNSAAETSSGACAATMLDGLSALEALTELVVADEDLSGDGTAGLLRAVAALPDLRLLELRRCTLRCGEALQLAARSPCVHAGEVMEATARLPRLASAMMRNSDNPQAMPHAQAGAERGAEGGCHGVEGPAALLAAMHAAHACAAMSSHLTMLDLVQCSMPEVLPRPLHGAGGAHACHSLESTCMHASCDCCGCQWLRGIEYLHVDCKTAAGVPATGAIAGQLYALLPRLCHLRELRLCAVPLGDTDTASAAAAVLCQLSVLRVLRLEDCRITSRTACAILAAVAELSQLCELSLSRNPLRAGGAAAAATHLPRLPALTRLSFASCAMGGGGGALFADALAYMPELRHVDLARNLVNEAVVRRLAAALRQAPRLREVVVFEEFFSQRAQEALLRAAPEGCAVVFRDCCRPAPRS